MRLTIHLPAVAAAALGACTETTRPSDAPVPSLATSWQLVSTIAFTSTRDDPLANPLLAAEIYLMDGGGGNPRRITANADGDGFPTLSPDGKKIAFESNRLRVAGEPLNTSDLFLMNADGTEQEWLIRGASANWSPDGKHVVFHRSASGTALPIKPDPGAATFDSDIFMMNVDDALISAASPTNLTNSPGAIDDDPDWSPDGNRIVFTSHDATDNHLNSVTAEIYVIDVSGSGGPPVQLTDNLEEERAAAWSPDGTRISFMCRRGGSDFEICVMNADGTGQVQLTNNAVFDGSGSWSVDGQQIVFSRAVGGGRQQLFRINVDGTGEVQLTNTSVGTNVGARWGLLRVRVTDQP